MSFVWDTSALFQRYVTKLFRNPTLLVTNLVTPVLFLALFSQMLGKLNVFPGVGASFGAYLTPGILVMCSIMFTVQAGLSIVNDLNSGFLPKMLVTRVSRGAILMGRLLTDSLMVVFASVLVILTAFVMGIRFVTGVPGILLMLVSAAFFGLAWAGIFLAIGLKTKSPESLSAISSGVVFILLFLSSAVFPTSIMPKWVQTFSSWNPVSYVANAMRSAIQGGYEWHAFVTAYALTAAMAIGAFSVALYQFRKITR